MRQQTACGNRIKLMISPPTPSPPNLLPWKYTRRLKSQTDWKDLKRRNKRALLRSWVTEREEDSESKLIPSKSIRFSLQWREEQYSYVFVSVAGLVILRSLFSKPDKCPTNVRRLALACWLNLKCDTCQSFLLLKTLFPMNVVSISFAFLLISSSIRDLQGSVHPSSPPISFDRHWLLSLLRCNVIRQAPLIWKVEEKVAGL